MIKNKTFKRNSCKLQNFKLWKPLFFELRSYAKGFASRYTTRHLSTLVA